MAPEVDTEPASLTATGLLSFMAPRSYHDSPLGHLIKEHLDNRHRQAAHWTRRRRLSLIVNAAAPTIGQQ